MTGYGYGEACFDERKFTIELKSVNHRYCEVVFRMPRVMFPLEDRLRQIVKKQIGRGRVDAYVSVQDTQQKPRQVQVDKTLAVAYYKEMEELRALLSINSEIEVKDLVTIPDMFIIQESAENAEEWWPAMELAINKALAQLLNMRAVEGVKLGADIEKRIKNISELNDAIATRAPLVVIDYRKRLNQCLAEWKNELTLDANRLESEVVLFADRANITEETVRLTSHLEQAFKCLTYPEPVGRRLDFLVQEMNREINTIGSKANDLQITNMVVAAKSDLEKIREQVQNIE